MRLSTDLATSPDDRVLPRYDGRSILNLVTSLTAQLGLPPASPLFAAPLPLHGAERVVLLVIDGMGHYLMNRHLERGEMPWLAGQMEAEAFGYQTATSTLPSSTMIALTTIHTGVPPAQHGWLATTVFQGDTVTDLLRQTDLGAGQPGSSQPGSGHPGAGRPLPTPDDLINVSSVYRRLHDIGVPSGYVSPAAYEGQFLDRFYFGGGRPFRYSPAAPLPAQVARALEKTRYVMAYWPEYDTTNHIHGPSGGESAAAARVVDDLIRQTVEALPQDGKTLLVVTADHGQRDTPGEAVGPVAGELVAGENRFRYLHSPEQAAQMGAATVIPSAQLWEEGVFGGPPARPEFLERTGTYTAIVQGQEQLTYDYGAGPLILKGNHGGWSAEEMVVPILTFRR